MKLRAKIGRVITMTLPILLSLLFVGQNVYIYYFGYSFRLFNLVGGTSLLTIAYIYIMSFVFKLYSHHRMFLYYLFTVNSFCLYDSYVGIPIGNLAFILGIVISFGICTILYGILIFIHNKKEHK